MIRTHIACSLLAALTLAPGPIAADVRGVVRKNDPDRKELTIELLGPRVRGQQLTLVIDAETRVQVGGQPGKLGDLTAGKRVRVSYETRNGKPVATAITAPNLLGLVSEVAGARTSTPAAAPLGADSVAGELRRVARTDRELVVLDPATKRETVLAVPEDLTVVKQGKPAQFEDLKEGEHAVVRYEERDGKRIARSVAVGEGGAIATPDNRIQRIRQVLKMVDMLLDLAERR